MKYTLIFTLTLLLNIAVLFAETDTLTTGEVLVTARRVDLPYSEVSRTIRVIDKEYLEKTHFSSIEDLMRFVPGIDIRQRGAHGVQSDINIRGGNFDEVLILINGVPVNDPQTGHHSLNIPINYPDIERIEILSGPGSRVLGANAFSGAVNIITKSPDGDNINMSAMGGGHNLYNAGISGGIKISDLSNYISVSKKGSDGYIKNTDFRMISAFYEGNMETNIGDFNLLAGYNEKSFGANSFYSARYPDQYEETGTIFSSLLYRTGDRLKFSSSLFYRRNQDKFILIRQNPSVYTNHHLTNIVGAQTNLNIKWDNMSSSFGVELRNESILSNRLGKPLTEDIKVPGEEAYFSNEDNRMNGSIFFEQNISAGKLNVSGGAMMNYNSVFNWHSNYGLDMNYDLQRGYDLSFTFNKAIRLPTFTDIYYEGPDIVGNIDLMPEEAYSFESGVKYSSRFLSGAVSIFYRDGNNIIDWVYTKIDTMMKWKAENITEINSRGIDITGVLDLRSLFDFSFPESIRFGYTYNDLIKGGQNRNLQTKYSFDFLRHKFVATGTFRFSENFQLIMMFSYNNRAGSFETGDGSFEKYPDYFLLDGTLRYSIINFVFYMSASNILNESYYNVASVLMPGIWVFGGIEYKLDFN